MNFINLKEAVQSQFDTMVGNELFYIKTDKDVIWNLYLDSFPEGTNNIYRERREFDCNCCKQFIRSCGNVVSIVNGELVSIWDIDVGGHFQVVANALSTFVKEQAIDNIYRSDTRVLGTDRSHQQTDDGVIKWDHFYYKLPSKFVSTEVGSFKGIATANKEILQRSLEEISTESIEIVLELIAQNSLYRGEEHKKTVQALKKAKKGCESKSGKDKDLYLWYTSANLKEAGRFKNTVIGTLLVDISSGVELEAAVRMFESKVAPQNYKRSSALITQGMIKKAEQKVAELGIEDALYRRYAVTEDVTINNVLFADRSAKKAMGVFDQLGETVKDSKPNLDKIEEVGIKDFIHNILPKANTLELMVENSHINNFTSLISPINKDAKPILKWGNNFSWSYNGEVADSMKERVKKAGGNVDGVLRFSIQWNDGDNNQNDFDAHCIEPKGNLISFNNKGRRQASSGMLDVDVVSPKGNVAVENIIYTDKNKMPNGDYEFLVHNFSHNGGMTGFTAEIEYEGKVYSYTYDRNLKNRERVSVAKINFSKERGMRFISSLPSTESTKEVWGISTNKWQKVSMLMNSPNHWDGNETGNKHWFFILQGCVNPDKARGFYNEFLTNDLLEHRKVFEVLGSKLKVGESNNQLSGLGFSSTQNNHVLCKVSGNFNRVIKINF